MNTCLVKTCALVGVDGHIVEVECDISNSLPGLMIVGLGGKAVAEAKERIRSAIRNSGLSMPPKKITINLAPADMPKDGTAYDLGIAVSILLASNQIQIDEPHLFLGELSLNGKIKPVKGILSYLAGAKESSINNIFLPKGNSREASMIEGLNIYPIDDLLEIKNHFDGEQLIEQVENNVPDISRKRDELLIDHIYGQEAAKRAISIAVAGNHNILLSGPPGSGKTMLAKASAQLLPPPSQQELIEISKIHSIAQPGSSLPFERPFRSPHHSTSASALLGGGSKIKPGEVSLSHKGILFLDELPEFHRDVLESLREPLESQELSIARSNYSVRFPADFMLIAAKNPCPCGHLGDEAKNCRCSDQEIKRYSSKISGPLLDRFDICVEVPKIKVNEISKNKGVSGSWLRSIRAARNIQSRRFEDGRTNARMTNSEVSKYCKLDSKSEEILNTAYRNLALSTRGYIRTLKVARTIADMDGHDKIQPTHIGEALNYRFKD